MNYYFCIWLLLILLPVDGFSSNDACNHYKSAPPEFANYWIKIKQAKKMIEKQNFAGTLWIAQTNTAPDETTLAIYQHGQKKPLFSIEHLISTEFKPDSRLLVVIPKCAAPATCQKQYFIWNGREIQKVYWPQSVPGIFTCSAKQ